MTGENENVNNETETPTEESSEGKGQEIDWSKIDPTAIPHEVVEKSGAFKGLLKSTSELREEAREQREQIGALKAQMDALDESGDDDDAGDDDGAGAGYEDPNRYVTKAELKREREKEHKTALKAQQKEAATKRAEFENASLAKAQAEFTEETQGKGFDFDTVMAEGKEYMSKNHPDECLAALRSTRDPAKALYYLYRSLVPEFRARDRALAAAGTLDQIKAGIIGKTGGAGSKGGTTDPSKMSDAELEASLAQE